MVRSTAKGPVVVLALAGLLACSPPAVRASGMRSRWTSSRTRRTASQTSTSSTSAIRCPFRSGNSLRCLARCRCAPTAASRFRSSTKSRPPARRRASCQAEIEAGLKSVVLNPKVTSSFRTRSRRRSRSWAKSASLDRMPLERETGVAQALAAAGGLTTFAHKDRIFVVRSTPEPVRIHFTYEALTRKVGKASQFRLKPGDIIVVE